jgi:hypothetical protein
LIGAPTGYAEAASGIKDTYGAELEEEGKMYKVLGTIAAIVTVCLYSTQPVWAFTQTDCNHLAKVQSDPSGREINEKMRVDSQGNCKPEPPGAKDPTALKQVQSRSVNR